MVWSIIFCPYHEDFDIVLISKSGTLDIVFGVVLKWFNFTKYIAIYKQPFFTSFICFDFVFIHLDLQFFVISFFFNFNILSSSMIYI